MRMRCYRWVSGLILFAFCIFAHAQALPKMNNAVTGVINHKIAKKGFAANDPVFGATAAAVGTGLTAVAGGAAAVAAGTVTWPVVLVGAGVSALVAGALYLITDGADSWLFRSDGQIEVSKPSSAFPSIVDPTTSTSGLSRPFSFDELDLVSLSGLSDFARFVRSSNNSPFFFAPPPLIIPSGISPFYYSSHAGVTVAADPATAIAAALRCNGSYPGYQCKGTINPATGLPRTHFFQPNPSALVLAPASPYGSDWNRNDKMGLIDYITVPLQRCAFSDMACAADTSIMIFKDQRNHPSSVSCPAGYYFVYSTSQCVMNPLFSNISAGTETALMSPSGAVSSVPASVLDQPISPSMLAAAANAAWRSASVGTSVQPWDATNPVTEADAREWISSRPGEVPTVRDFTSPVAPPGSSFVPMVPPVTPGTNPTPTPTPTPTPNPGPGGQTTPTVDLGPDPGVPVPSLENIPTAQMILAPLLGLMPDLRAFTLPVNAGVCPVASFSVWGKQFIIDTHCLIFEQHREMLGLAFVLGWSLFSLAIFLRA